MTVNARTARTLGLLLVVTLLVGCGGGPKMGRYEYRVSIDESMRDPNTGMMPSVEVDFVGVKDPELARWEAQSIDDYFVPNNPQRSGANRHTMRFTNENSGAQKLAANAPEWGKWQGAEYMFILASVPLDPSRFAVDPRRIRLPLDKARWKKGEPINILIKPSGVELQSEMIPEKN